MDKEKLRNADDCLRPPKGESASATSFSERILFTGCLQDVQAVSESVTKQHISVPKTFCCIASYSTLLEASLNLHDFLKLTAASC